jgi:hypothetical protein
MDILKWSESEKKLSRRVFEAALEAELSEILAEFKSKAAAAATAEAMWALEEYLADSSSLCSRGLSERGVSRKSTSAACRPRSSRTSGVCRNSEPRRLEAARDPSFDTSGQSQAQSERVRAELRR